MACTRRAGCPCSDCAMALGVATTALASAPKMMNDKENQDFHSPTTIRAGTSSFVPNTNLKQTSSSINFSHIYDLSMDRITIPTSSSPSPTTGVSSSSTTTSGKVVQGAISTAASSKSALGAKQQKKNNNTKIDKAHKKKVKEEPEEEEVDLSATAASRYSLPMSVEDEDEQGEDGLNVTGSSSVFSVPVFGGEEEASMMMMDIGEGTKTISTPTTTTTRNNADEDRPLKGAGGGTYDLTFQQQSSSGQLSDAEGSAYGLPSSTSTAPAGSKKKPVGGTIAAARKKAAAAAAAAAAATVVPATTTTSASLASRSEVATENMKVGTSSATVPDTTNGDVDATVIITDPSITEGGGGGLKGHHTDNILDELLQSETIAPVATSATATATTTSSTPTSTSVDGEEQIGSISNAGFTQAPPLAVSEQRDGSADAAAAAVAAAAAAALESMPIADRLASKQANARKSAILELIKAVSNVSPSGAPLSSEQSSALTASMLNTSINDGNALNSEAGIQLCAALVTQVIGASSSSSSSSSSSPFFNTLRGAGKELITKIVNKGFNASRPALCDTAIDAVVGIMMYIDGIESGIHEVTQGLKTMTKPRVVRACARVIVRTCSKFVVSKIKPDTFITALPTMLLSADKGVSSAGLDLARGLVEIYPRAIETMCDEYGKKQGGFSAELVASIKSAAPLPVVSATTTTTTTTAATTAAATAAAAAAASTAANDPCYDANWDTLDEAFKFAEPEDVLKRIDLLKLDATLGTTTATTVKWGDKVTAITTLSKVLEKSPRLAGDSHMYSDTLALLRRCIKDSNANVVASALLAHVAFAARLHSLFGSGAKLALTEIVNKLKDKNRTVINAATTTIKAFVRWQCVSIEEIVTEVDPEKAESWKKLSADMKSNLTALVASLVTSPSATPQTNFTGTSAPVLARIRSLAMLSEITTSDPAPDVKQSGEKLLGALIARLTTPKKQGTAHGEIVKLFEKLSPAASDRVLVFAGLKESPQQQAQQQQALAAAAAAVLGATMGAGSGGGGAAATKKEAALSTTTTTMSSTSVAAASAAPAVKKTTGATTTKSSSISAAATSTSTSSSTAAANSNVDALYESLIAEEPGTLMSADDAQDLLIGLNLPTFTLATANNLDAKAVWTEKKDALLSLTATVCTSLSSTSSSSSLIEAAVAFLHGRTKGFTVGLNNTNILIGCAQTFEKIAQACTSASHFSRRAACIVLDCLLPYTKEKKGCEEVGSMSLAMAFVVGPCFVASRLMSCGAGEKATPGVMTAVNDRLANMVSIFGIGRLAPLPIMTHFASAAGVQSANLPTKTAALKGLMNLHRLLGPPLLSSLAKPKCGINEMLLKTITTEANKPENAYDVVKARAELDATKAALGEKMAPKVLLHGESVVSASASGGGGNTTTTTSSSSNNFTTAPAFAFGDTASSSISGPAVTVDVMSLLPKSILYDMDVEVFRPEDEKKPKGGKEDDLKPWQVRMKAVETVTKQMTTAVQDGTMIVANENTTALLRALRKRLADTQANTRPKACLAIAAIAKACGPSIGTSNGFKIVVPGLLDLLGEKKGGVKESALQALDQLVMDPAGNGGIAAVNYCAVLEAALKGTSPILATAVGGGREELLPWLAARASFIPKSSTMSTPLFQALVTPCMEACGDKSPATRAGASDLLVHVVRIAGTEYVRNALKMLKPTHRMTVEPIIESTIATAKALASGTGSATATAADGSAGATNAAAAADEAVITIVPGLGATTSVASSAKAVPSKSTTLAATTTNKSKLGATAKAGASSKTGSSTSAGAAASAAASAMNSVDKFMVYAGASNSRTERTRSRFAENYLTGFNIRLGEGSGDIGTQYRRLYNLTGVAFHEAKCLSPELHSFMFADGDTASDKNITAMKWLTSLLLALPDDAAAAATMPAIASHVEFARHHTDLLLRYIAVQIWEPRGKPAVVSTAHFLLDRLLTLLEGHGWGISWAEGEILLPALCEKAGHASSTASTTSTSSTSTVTSSASASAEKAAGLLVRFLSLCSACSEYSAVAGEAALVGVLLTHIFARVLDVKAKLPVRIALAQVAARVVRDAFRRSSSVAPSARAHRCAMRNTTIAHLARYCEKDGMGKDAKTTQNVDLRNAMGEILTEVFLVDGSDWSVFWKLCHLDSRPAGAGIGLMMTSSSVSNNNGSTSGGATGGALSYGVTMDIEPKLRGEFEKKWMNVWLQKREKDVRHEARAFADRGAGAVAAEMNVEASTQPKPTLMAGGNNNKNKNTGISISDDEIVASMMNPGAGSGSSSSTSITTTTANSHAALVSALNMTSSSSISTSSHSTAAIDDDEITGALLFVGGATTAATSNSNNNKNTDIFSPERPAMKSRIGRNFDTTSNGDLSAPPISAPSSLAGILPLELRTAAKAPRQGKQILRTPAAPSSSSFLESSNNSSIMSDTAVTCAESTSPTLPPGCPVLLPDPSEISLEAFSAVPRGLTFDCPVEVASPLTNLRTACRSIADTLGLTMTSNGGKGGKHASDPTVGPTLKSAFTAAATACEALHTTIIASTTSTAATATSSTTGTAHVHALSVLAGIVANAAAILDTLSLAWLIIPAAPLDPYNRSTTSSNDAPPTTSRRESMTSPAARNRTSYQREAERAMQALPQATSALLRDVEGIGKASPMSASYGLLSALEASLGKYWHLKHGPTYELRNRCLMNAVFWLRRDHVAAWLLETMRANAAWVPTTPFEPAPLVPASKRFRSLRTLLRRLPSYEYRQSDQTNANSTAVVGSGWIRAGADLELLARHFIGFFDDPIVAKRTRALMSSSSNSAVSSSTSSSADTMSFMMMSTISPGSANGGGSNAANLTSEALGCDMDDDGRIAVAAAIDAARELFVGAVGQVTLALGASFQKNTSSSKSKSSFTRTLYHRILTCMATTQGVTSLSLVKPWAWDDIAAREAHLRLANAGSSSSSGMGATTTTTTSSDALGSTSSSSVLSEAATVTSLTTMMLAPTPAGKHRRNNNKEKRGDAALTPHDAFTVERIRSIPTLLFESSSTTSFEEQDENEGGGGGGRYGAATLIMPFDEEAETVGRTLLLKLKAAAQAQSGKSSNNNNNSATTKTVSSSSAAYIPSGVLVPATPLRPSRPMMTMTEMTAFTPAMGGNSSSSSTTIATTTTNTNNNSNALGLFSPPVAGLSFETMLAVPPTPMPATKAQLTRHPRLYAGATFANAGGIGGGMSSLAGTGATSSSSSSFSSSSLSSSLDAVATTSATSTSSSSSSTSTSSSLVPPTPTALKTAHAPRLLVPAEIARLPVLAASASPPSAPAATSRIPQLSSPGNTAAASSNNNTFASRTLAMSGTSSLSSSGIGSKASTTASADHTPHPTLPPLKTVRLIASKLTPELLTALDTILDPMFAPGVTTDSWKQEALPALASLAKSAVTQYPSLVPEARIGPSAWKDVLANDPLASAFYVRVTEALTPARAKVLWAYLNRLTAPPTRSASGSGGSGSGAAEEAALLARCGIFAVARYITAACSGMAGKAAATTAVVVTATMAGSSSSGSQNTNAMSNAARKDAAEIVSVPTTTLSAGVGPDQQRRRSHLPHNQRTSLSSGANEESGM